MTTSTATQTKPTEPSGPIPDADTPEPPDGSSASESFRTALEAEVARRIDAVERRWQSRKDRELNRARRRWESEAGQAIDPELLTWIAQADPREVGQWLKAGLTDDSARTDSASDQTPQPAESPVAEESAAPQSAEAAEQPGQANTNPSADPDSADKPDDSGSESESPADQQPAADLEHEAQTRDRLAERRSQDPSPDLFPSRGAPADAFQRIEAGFARGEVDLDTYETARRRRGLN